jgi:Zn finger protein HypA/HybF involved in hydrogenase expression
MRAWLTRLGVFLLIALGAASTGFAQTTVESLVQPDLLSAAHLKLEADCSSCHLSFRKAAQSSLCADCHKPVRDDIAKGTGFHGKEPLVRQSECSNCHAEHKGRDFKASRLTEITFDHAKTDFPLDGKHARADCAGCHKPGKKYSEAPGTCVGCHDADQPHRGNLGTECQTCHGTSDWGTLAPFDHGKTQFPLLGGHAKATCFSCHVGEVYKGLSKTCAACHAVQDVHAGRFGSDCAACHTVETWKHKAFDHGKATGFRLDGAHAAASCSQCHGAKLTSKPPKDCAACHAAQDAHKGQLGNNCGACHQAAAWRQDVTFDHAKTKFPLLGQHAAVACEACHATPAFQDAKTECAACHKDAGVHQGRFTGQCETCHTASSWKQITFDHGRDTKFKLTGIHAKAGCNACHKQTNVPSATLPTECYSCHKAQDVHRGAFGRNCVACHTTSSFKTAIIRK